MYDQFVEFIARPVYRFVVKPIIYGWELMKKFFKYFGKFLWYLMFATTGNIIELSIILTLVAYRAKIIPHIPEINDYPWMLGVVMVTILFLGVVCSISAYNILNWIFSSDRRDIIGKEPEFIQTIVNKIDMGFHNLKRDVKKSDASIRYEKRKRKEKKEMPKKLLLWRPKD